MQTIILKTLLAEKHARELGFEHTADVLRKQADRLLYKQLQSSPRTLSAANNENSPAILHKIKAAQSKS